MSDQNHIDLLTFLRVPEAQSCQSSRGKTDLHHKVPDLKSGIHIKVGCPMVISWASPQFLQEPANNPFIDPSYVEAEKKGSKKDSHSVSLQRSDQGFSALSPGHVSDVFLLQHVWFKLWDRRLLLNLITSLFWHISIGAVSWNIFGLCC